MNTDKYNHTFVEQKVKYLLKNKNFYEYNPKHKGPVFSIILPPPNVTGKLHLGHAWDVSLQDAIIRYKHLQGFNTIWISSLDHASISTQTKFEKILKQTENKTRFDFTKQQFLNKLNNWCEQQKSFIQLQWQSLNLALSFKSQCFTLDKHVNQAVNHWFVDAYNEGFIYQDYKLVNWDMQLQTAISDIEVIYKKTNSKMYYCKYFLQNSNEFLLVATTRPETMFGDVCLVVNPKDKINAKYIGKKAINPINSQPLEIIGDSYVQLGFGTNIMKCTPAHDFNDYNLAKKHKLTNYFSVFNSNGTLNDHCIDFLGNSYTNLPIRKARELVVKFLQNNGLVVKIDDIVNDVGYSERTNTVVEPFLSKQWFVKMKLFAKKIIDLQLKNKGTTFIPLRFNVTLLKWLENIQDWCISRQLWWGHQLPIWYHKETKKIYVGILPPKDKKHWQRDEDVLDTWFSAGLWPLVCTKSRPEKQYKIFYPTSCLVTAYDILFFWIARMLTMCLYKSDTIPFNVCLIHGLVRDKYGQKMSKSIGNGIDPIKKKKKYGSDALKMYFTSSATMGEDLNFDQDKIKYYWNVLNKIWHVHKLFSSEPIKFSRSDLSNLDLWMLEQLKILQHTLLPLYDNFNFTIANKNLIDCFWNVFCNQYIEFVKFNLWNKQTKSKQNSICLFIFNEFLKLFYPIAPAITDYLYYKINKKYIWNTKWYDFKFNIIYDKLLVKHFINISNSLRDYRIKNSLSNKKMIEFDYITNDKIDVNQLNNLLLRFNFKLNIIIDVKPKDKFLLVIKTGVICLNNVFSNSDLQKQIKYIKSEINRSNLILSNKNFILKAPKEKVLQEKNKLNSYLKKYKILLSLLPKK